MDNSPSSTPLPLSETPLDHQPATTRLQGISTLLHRHPWIVAATLFVAFILITAPGISWGTPNIWHPDEIIIQVNKALSGELQFDQENFDYPSLPKYVMYGVGKLVLQLGYGEAHVIEAARLTSILMGAGSLVLAFYLVRAAGGSLLASFLAALFVLSSSEVAHNSRFAHNDLYLTFFVALAAYFSMNYWRTRSRKRTRSRLWLYAAFIAVGLAASSKYNGLGLILVPLFLFALDRGRDLFREWLSTLETLFISLALCFLAYAAGTPRALTAMAFYFKRMIPALLRHANYAREPGSVLALFGQWRVLAVALGLPVFLLFLVAMIWFGFRLIWNKMGKIEGKNQHMDGAFILLLAALAYDIPIMTSYNYPARFFVPLIPLLAAVTALFVEDLIDIARQRELPAVPKIVGAGMFLVLAYSFLRVVSVMLLFQNDARIAATQYIPSLRSGTSIEYTLYPPNIPPNFFSSKHNYPIFFKKFPNQPLPESKSFVFNSGEEGIETRKPDYLVVDSFTYARFQDPYICQEHQVECTFFSRLLNGETNYTQIREFSYALPPYLPQIQIDFVNPVIQVFARN